MNRPTELIDDGLNYRLGPDGHYRHGSRILPEVTVQQILNKNATETKLAEDMYATSVEPAITDDAADADTVDDVTPVVPPETNEEGDGKDIGGEGGAH